jgi:tRNA threonylcarbamoyladenosine biosynthesis protein TsaB
VLALGIDTAGRRAGIALADSDEVFVVRSSEGRHSGLLLPMIAEAFESQELDPHELALVGVASGPGTYTGLRVGVVTAKILGRSTGAVVVGVPTLEAMALQAPASVATVYVALHASKKRLLVALFDRKERGRLVARAAPELIHASSLVGEPPVGPGAAVITDAPELIPDLDDWGAQVPVLDTSAETVLKLARARHAAGQADESRTLAPSYLKPPPITLKPGLVKP